MNEYSYALWFQLFLEGLVEQIKLSFGQLLLHLIALIQQLPHNYFNLLIEPFLKLFGSEQSLAVLVVHLVLLVDEASRDETVLAANLMNMLLE